MYLISYNKLKFKNHDDEISIIDCIQHPVQFSQTHDSSTTTFSILKTGKKKKFYDEEEDTTPFRIDEEETGHGLLHLQHFPIGDKYTIDRKALSNGILILRYKSSRALLPDLKPQNVSPEMKAIIKQILTHKSFDMRLFHRLEPRERKLTELLIHKLKLNIDTGDDESFQRRFEIVKDELLCGNNSQSLKNEMRSMLRHLKQTGVINSHQELQFLYELGI